MQHAATPEELESPYGQVGLKFSLALLNGQYDQAYAHLGSELRGQWSPALLQDAYEGMVDYFTNPATSVSVELVDILDIEPSEELEDVMVYVSIVGDGNVEAVTLFVGREAERYVIQELELGRP